MHRSPEGAGSRLFVCPYQLGHGREPGLLCLFLIHSHHDIVEEAVDESIAGNGEHAGIERCRDQTSLLLAGDKPFDDPEILGPVAVEVLPDPVLLAARSISSEFMALNWGT